jgi:hypothetical protein
MSHNEPKNRQRLSQITFIFVAGVLLVAAITLNTVTQAMRLHFKKEAVPQPREFGSLPRLMGNWMDISQEEKLDKELEDVLGTDLYTYRDYIRLDLCGADLLGIVSKLQTNADPSTAASDPPIDPNPEKFNRASPDQQQAAIDNALKVLDHLNASGDKQHQQGLGRRELIYSLQKIHPDGVVDLGLTYYTGQADTVAHIPERCYIADGYEPVDSVHPVWDLGTDASGKPQKLEVRFISFEDQTAGRRDSKCVAYVFNVDGEYHWDPLDVRKTLQDLTQRYGYYAKIELMTIGKDTDLANKTMADFLAAAKPQIETCFPDWRKVTSSGR